MAALADFSKGSGKLKVYIDLAGEGASAEWHNTNPKRT